MQQETVTENLGQAFDGLMKLSSQHNQEIPEELIETWIKQSSAIVNLVDHLAKRKG